MPTSSRNQRFNGGPVRSSSSIICTSTFVDPVRIRGGRYAAPPGPDFLRKCGRIRRALPLSERCRLDSNPSLMPTPMGWSPARNKAGELMILLANSCGLKDHCCMADSAHPKYRAPALEKGLAVLECWRARVKPMSLNVISRHLKRSVSELFRMIQCWSFMDISRFRAPAKATMSNKFSHSA